MRTIPHSRTLLLALAGGVAFACGSAPAPPTPPMVCEYTASPTQLTPCMATAQLTATVTTQTGCAWSVSTTAPWITVLAGASSSGPGTLSVRIAENWDAPRTGVLSIAGSGTTETVRVSQAGCHYAVSQASYTFGPAGGSASFDVLQMSDPNTCGGPLQDACVWTAQSDSPWIVLAVTTSRSGDQRVSFTVASNATGAARSGTIAVRDKTVRVEQSR